VVEWKEKEDDIVPHAAQMFYLLTLCSWTLPRRLKEGKRADISRFCSEIEKEIEKKKKKYDM